MFYYLLYNSSFSFILNNRLFSTILYGSILYIFTHAILNYCKLELLEIINNYFWFILILDILSLIYCVYQQLLLSENIPNNCDVSFNLLKNQINTISSYFNKKNEISITTSRPPIRISTPSNNPIHPTQSTQHTQSAQSTSPMQSTNAGQYLNTTQKQNYNISTGLSTPLTALRGVVMPEESIENSISDNSGELQTESIAGSDIGSIMDLDDFEKSL